MKFSLFLFIVIICQSVYAQDKNFEWINHSLVFQNNIDNEVAYIDFGDSQIWGWIEVTLTAGYSHRLATGKYTKRFSVGKNTGNDGYFYQDSEVLEAFDRVAAQWKIGKLEKGENGNLILPIYHIDNKRNSLLITVRGNSLTPVDTSLFTIINPVVVPNTEVRDHVYFRDSNVGIGIEIPEEKLHVKGNSLLEGNLTINQYSPRIFLKRNTDNGGYIQGIQTQLNDGTDNFYFGNLHSEQWIITKGKFDGQRLFTVKSNGNVGIGTNDPNGWKLSVNGNIRAKEIKVETDWSDFVFEEDYNLPTLQEVERHIEVNGHLQDIPSAKEVAENGIFLGEMDSKLLQKIEELMLYTIKQNKEILELKKKLIIIENRLDEN